jgi:CBS domain containing-hemolysin-like protein
VTEVVLLAVAVALIAANALFVAAEFSLVTVDRSTVERAAEAGDAPSRGVLAALQTLSTQLSGAQLGITVTSLAVGFLAEPSLASLLRGPLSAVGVSGPAATGTSILLALAIATGVQMVLGELVPKNLAIARPLPVARRVVGAQRGFTAATRPLLAFLNGSANRILRLMGIEPREELRSARSPQELTSLVERSAEHGTLPEPTANLLARSLQFGDKTAADVLTPRVRVQFLAADQPVAQVLAAAARTGHSRFPVTGSGVDDVVGMVHVKHAVAVPVAERTSRPIRDVMVAPVLVPSTVELDPLLSTLRDHGLQMAVVVDEYGGTDGVVTLEDLVEELVGDIADEHDRPGSHARRRRDGSWSLSGLLRPDEVRQLTGVALPDDGNYETLGGLVADRLGRLPETGDAVRLELAGGNVDLSVERMDGLRVDRVRLTGASRSPGGASALGARSTPGGPA